jgi:ubiquinone/menaquinone biosynthesis C-methylase UbiE
MSIEKAYDFWANQYDTNQNRTRDLDKISTIETLSKYDFKSVLELGCGTGKNTKWLLLKAK